MSYQAKTDWKMDDTVTEDDFNRIERGVGDAHTAIESVNGQIQADAARQSIDLSKPVQVVESAKRSRLKIDRIKGRTLTNLLGAIGGDSLPSALTSYNAAVSTDTASYTSGTRSTLVTATGTTVAEHFASTDRLPILPSRQYVFIGDIQTTKGVAGYRFIFRDSAGNVLDDVSTGGTLAGGWTTTGLLITTKSTAVTMEMRVQVFKNDGSLNYVPSGEAARFDSARLYQVNAADYDSLKTYDLPEWNRRFPFVLSSTSTTGIHITRYGDNLAPSFREWTFINVGTITESYTHMVTANGTEQNSQTNIKAVPGTTYTFSVTKTNGGKIGFDFRDAQNVGLAGTGLVDAASVTLKAPPNTASINIVTSVPASVPSGVQVEFKNPTLNIGSTALPFKPRVYDYLYFSDVTLASSIAGDVADEIYEQNGKYYKLNTYRQLTVDGSLNWFFNIAVPGLKRVWTESISGYYSHHYADFQRFDGKILLPGAHNDGPDRYTFEENLKLFVTIANKDSGWGDNYTPTADEIKAYFNGWTMYTADDPTGKTPYNNSGTKLWRAHDAFGGGRSTGTLPTDRVPGMTPYALSYRLTQPYVTEIKPEGGISLNEGLNQIETGVGMIVRERANPFRDGNGAYNINNGNYPTSNLARRTGKILNIYRNRVEDGTWVRGTDMPTPSGVLAQSKYYDPAAVYEVTYLALDPISAPLASITAIADTNLKTVVDTLADANADVETRVGVLERDAFSKQGGTVGPLKINGNAGTMGLVGKDHTYVEFFPKGIEAGRRAYIGYPGAGINALHINNHDPGGNIDLLPGVGGAARIDGNNIWHEGRLRSNNGTLEFNDGTGWKAVGAGADQYKPLIKRQTLPLGGAEVINAINLTGKCYLSKILVMSSNNPAKLKVYVDGAVWMDTNVIAGAIGGIVQNSDIGFSDGWVGTYGPDSGPQMRKIGGTGSGLWWARPNDFPNGAYMGQTYHVVIPQPIYAKSSIRIEVSGQGASTNLDVDFAGGVPA
ncbi:hypothetical protein [Paenibacillus chitinolyticus]